MDLQLCSYVMYKTSVECFGPSLFQRKNSIYPLNYWGVYISHKTTKHDTYTP
uniref:Uncharacterized protein n=1 Tax=Arundo donax TaxID=35708 RepID=A0A0A8ZBQ9_ARUDO